jgi:hypothetical protein
MSNMEDTVLKNAYFVYKEYSIFFVLVYHKCNVVKKSLNIISIDIKW